MSLEKVSSPKKSDVAPAMESFVAKGQDAINDIGKSQNDGNGNSNYSSNEVGDGDSKDCRGRAQVVNILES